jgi:hypothetical protein
MAASTGLHEVTVWAGLPEMSVPGDAVNIGQRSTSSLARQRRLQAGGGARSTPAQKWPAWKDEERVR